MTPKDGSPFAKETNLAPTIAGLAWARFTFHRSLD